MSAAFVSDFPIIPHQSSQEMFAVDTWGVQRHMSGVEGWESMQNDLYSLQRWSENIENVRQKSI